MKKLFILLLVCLSFNLTYGQEEIDISPEEKEGTGGCIQSLQLARALYDEGKLNEIPATLESSECLNQGSLDEKVEMYRLLAVTYLYLNEPAKADEAMLKLLRTNPEYQPNDELDPAEYQLLYQSFRTKWLFRVGIHLGGVYTIPHVLSNMAVSEPGAYKGGIGFQGGVFAEFSITDQIFLQPEVYYTSKNYSYTNGAINYSEDNSSSAGSEVRNRILNYIELFAVGKYRIWPDKGYYASIAPGVGYLLNAEQTSTEVEILSNDEKPGFSLTEIDFYEKINPQLFIGVGTEFKIGRKFYLTLDLRYGYSFKQLINEENRYKIYETINVPTAVDSDHKLHTISLSIGVLNAIYRPVKIAD